MQLPDESASVVIVLAQPEGFAPSQSRPLRELSSLPAIFEEGAADLVVLNEDADWAAVRGSSPSGAGQVRVGEQAAAAVGGGVGSFDLSRAYSGDLIYVPENLSGTCC